jgi:hypothetical protein
MVIKVRRREELKGARSRCFFMVREERRVGGI